jgi:uncharacterized phage infection (PIP) family protein YhgE
LLLVIICLKYDKILFFLIFLKLINSWSLYNGNIPGTDSTPPPIFPYIHPYLPLTYGVGALREVITGAIWLILFNIGILVSFPAVAVVLSY